MFCIIAFVVLSILGIFSATNRNLAREALDCVLRRVTLRPCNTGFDEKMKARILGSVITRSETAARVLNKNFELLSWTFFILLTLSSIWSVRGLFLFYTTGSCNGLNQSGFCVFDPKGDANKVSTITPTCSVDQVGATGPTLKGVDLSGFPTLNPQGKDKIVFIGCYYCDYTRKTYPMIRDLVQHFNVNLTFLPYPVKEKADDMERLSYCTYQQDPEKYWKLNDALFAADLADLPKEEFIQKTLTEAGYDVPRVNACRADPQTKDTVKKQMDQILKTQFYGTPTVFINGNESLVGPKPYRVYAIPLKGLFYWLQ